MSQRILLLFFIFFYINSMPHIEGSINDSRRYVLTGGPGVGKSTIVAELAKKGYLTVPETCSAFCEKMSKNKTLETFFEDPLGFQTALMMEQLKSESLLPITKPAFLDRSAVDIIAYGDYFNIEMPEQLRKMAMRNYDLIFIIDPLPINLYQNNHIRRETPEQSLQIHTILVTTYKQCGYREDQLINVPFNTPANRAQFILDTISLIYGESNAPAEQIVF